MENKVVINTGITDHYGCPKNIVFYAVEHPHRGMEYFKYNNLYEMYEYNHFTTYKNERSWKAAISRTKNQFK